MPINTLEIPPPTQPTFKPKPEQPPEEDKFRYGWRYLTKTLPGGQDIYYKMPLTLENSLNPQEDDIVPQRPRHAGCSIDIFDMLKNRYAFEPTVGVFYDFIMKWGLEYLDEPAPDVTVIPNLKDKNINSGSFKVKQEGTRPCLVIEVVSPSSKTDYTSKVDTYEQAGIKEYIIVEPHSKLAKPFYEIKGYRLINNQYLPIKPDKEGCLLSQTTSVLFCVSDNKQRLRLKDLKTGDWLLTAQEEMEARLEEREARLKEMKARLEAETRKEEEREARQAEKQARQKAEQRADKAEQCVDKAEQSAEQAKNEAQQERLRAERFAEQLRALGINPDDILNK